MTEYSSPSNRRLNRKSPPQSFLTWLGSQTSLFIGHLLGLFSFLALVTSLLLNSLDTGEKLFAHITPALLQRIIFFAHLPFIGCCIIYLFIVRDVNNIDSKRVVEAHERIFGEHSRVTLKRSQRLLKEFKTYFLLFWFSMLALYLAFLFIGFLKDRGGPEYVASVQPQSVVKGSVTGKWRTGSEELTARDTTIQISEAKIPVERTPSKAAAPGTEKGHPSPDAEGQSTAAPYRQKSFRSPEWWEAFTNILPESIPFALNTISLMFVFWCLSILYLPYQNAREKVKQRRFLYISSLLFLLLIFCFPLFFNLARRGADFTDSGLLEYMTVFNAASGTLNAVVLALLIARLDSKLIGLPSRLVSTLYLYAAVQPLFVVFSQPGFVNEAIKTFVLLAVFILKIYFFLIIVFAMQTGRMLNYLYCFPALHSRVKSMFDNRFEILIQRKSPWWFDFIITRNHSLVYETDHGFHNRETCEAEVCRIQALMAERKSYRINSLGGAFTIEVWDATRKRCFSIDQTSRDEAEELILESIDSVPYCRLHKSPS